MSPCLRIQNKISHKLNISLHTFSCASSSTCWTRFSRCLTIVFCVSTSCCKDWRKKKQKKSSSANNKNYINSVLVNNRGGRIIFTRKNNTNNNQTLAIVEWCFFTEAFSSSYLVVVCASFFSKFVLVLKSENVTKNSEWNNNATKPMIISSSREKCVRQCARWLHLRTFYRLIY